jgi:hypothetical protein
MAEQTFIRRSCDFCDTKHDFPGQVEHMTPQSALDLAGWIQLTRVWRIDTQLFPVTKYACKDSCAQNIVTLGMLSLPPEVVAVLEERKRQLAAAQQKFDEARNQQQTEAAAEVPAVGGIEAKGSA